jgi:Domain of unknown function (DUF1707)
MAMRYYAPFPGGGGDPARHRAPHALRIGDAERDAVAADLGEHYAAGRLTLDELNERLDAAFAARTLGQLTRVMADLPGPWPSLMLPGQGGPGARPVLTLPDPWGPAGFHYHGYLGPAEGPWHLEGAAPDGYRDGQDPTPTDRAGRFAALSLLMLAMLIWLFTALLFARHGVVHPGGPPMMPQHGNFEQYQDYSQWGP